MTRWFLRLFFFFLMIRRPPRSTLFPYTTSSDLYWPAKVSSGLPFGAIRGGHIPMRSEEHTSELQSQSNLVCRLLLEKKNKGKVKEKGMRAVRWRGRCQEGYRTG